MGNQKDRVRLNVGGKIYETTAATLAKAGQNSLLGAMFDDNWNLRSDTITEHFIDRNPDYFSVLLDLLRTGELYIPSYLSEKLLYQEALYYGLLDHVRSAKWGPLDGNRLRISQSVSSRALKNGTAIRASPDGGCCVAYENVMHVYDWMMEEHPQINLNYNKINDACWINPNNIVITTSKGIGLFSSSNGELRHKFDVEHKGEVEKYSACGLSFNSDNKIFASCRGISTNECGIGVWDQNTGKQVDFFYEPVAVGWSIGDAGKIQWIPGSNCLLVANLDNLKDRLGISLLDFRVKKIVNSWSAVYSTKNWKRDEHRVRDVIPMEGLSKICVVNEFEGLGFIDLRTHVRDVMWSPNRRHSYSEAYPKLGFHEGQLFCSMNGYVSVYCGADWVVSTRLQRSDCSYIRDISIGGDRLFALHANKNVFDIWEAPRSLII